MHAEDQGIALAVRDFILTEFLPDEDPKALENTTPLLSTGILDSIAILQLVNFLESRFRISIPPHEMNVDHLNSVAAITELVRVRSGVPPA
jgi:acyl carrier protein